MQPYARAVVTVIVVLGSVLAWAEEAEPPTLQEQLAQAAELRSQLQWDEAIALLREVVARRAEDEATAALAQCRIGQYLLEQSKPMEAEAELRKVAADFAGQVEAINWSRVFLIDAVAFQERLPAAIDDARGLVADPQASPKQQAWGRVKLGQRLCQAGQHGEAIAVLESVDDIVLEDKGPLLHASTTLGHLLVTLAMPERAIESLEFVAGHPSATDQDRNWARVSLLYAYDHAHRYDSITPVADGLIADGQAGKATDEQVAWARVWSGRLHARRAHDAEESGNTELATTERALAGQCYTQAASKGDNLTVGVHALLDLGDLRAREHSPELAAGHFGQAALKASQLGGTDLTVRAKVGQGQAMVQLGQLVQAEEVYLQALVLASGSSAWLHEVAWALGELALRRADWTSARSHFEDAHNQGRQAGLSGYPMERVQTRLAQLADADGDLETSIAWYRTAITDPVSLPGGEHPAAEAIAELFRRSGRSVEEEQWRLYLLEPTAQQDPTASIVAGVFGDAPPAASVGPVRALAGRHAALGEFYRGQRRLPEAQLSFEQALQVAQSDWEKAEARCGLSQTYSSIAWRQRTHDLDEQAATSELLARQHADAALQHWISVAQSGRAGDAHAAMEAAVKAYFTTVLGPESLGAAQQIISSLGSTPSPSKMAFAQFMKVRALAWNRQYLEAIQSGLELDAQYATSTDPAVLGIRIATRCRVALYYVRAGDVATGMSLLGQIETMYPGRFGYLVDPYRGAAQGVAGIQ